MQFLSSNNQAHNETLFFESFFTQSNNSIHSFPPRINPNISTAIDEHISLLGSTNNQFGCNTQPLNTCLDLQQVLSQYLSAQPCSGSNIFNTNPPESLNSFNHNTATVPIYPLQMVMNQLREGTSNIDPCSSVNTRPLPVQAQLTHTPTIMYHSIEDCIMDENNMFGNINVLNADETKQTKIVIMPTVVYGKYLQPILDQIKERLFNHQPFQTDISSNNSSLTPDNTELCERVLSVADHNQQINMDNEIEEEDDLFSQDEQSTKVLSMEVKNSNNYKKTNNKKGIKKKRKYIKSGLYRKNRNGDFLFSSADRSRLATLIVTTPGGSTSQQANGELDINQSSTDNESPLDRYYDNSEDRLGFELYCRETVPLHKDAGSNTLLLKEQWKVLPQEERDRYKQSVAMGAIMQTQQIIHQDFSQGELFTQLENEDFSEMVKDTNGKYSRVKRPLNAYNIFCKLHFPEFQQQYPDLSINQISKLIGEKWKSLSIDEKQPYIEKSKNSQCKVVFKKPLNSYNLYCKQNFELFKKKYPELSIHLLSRKVADSWKSLGEDVKRTYYEDALKQRQENLVQVQQTISK